MAMSLISLSTLVKKNISVLFVPVKAVLFDMDNGMPILGHAEQDEAGLFYIPDVL